MNCSTIKEGFEKYCRYEKIIDSTSISAFESIDKVAVFSNRAVDKALESNKQFSDFKVAGMLSYIKLLSKEDFQLKEVHFTYPKPKDISEYKRIFQSKVCFEKPVNALLFNSELLNSSILEPNKNLLHLFEKNR